MLEYVGNGAYLQGVPARDLTDDEAIEAGGPDALVASRLYVQRPEIATDVPAVASDDLNSTARKRK